MSIFRLPPGGVLSAVLRHGGKVSYIVMAVPLEFPDFRTISEKEVAFVVKKLNNRPRKCLNYQTPHEVYRKALCGAL